MTSRTIGKEFTNCCHKCGFFLIAAGENEGSFRIRRISASETSTFEKVHTWSSLSRFRNLCPLLGSHGCGSGMGGKLLSCGWEGTRRSQICGVTWPRVRLAIVSIAVGQGPSGPSVLLSSKMLSKMYCSSWRPCSWARFAIHVRATLPSAGLPRPPMSACVPGNQTCIVSVRCTLATHSDG